MLFWLFNVVIVVYPIVCPKWDSGTVTVNFLAIFFHFLCNFFPA